MGFATKKNYRALFYINTLAIILLGAAVAVWGLFSMLPTGLGDDYGAIHASLASIRKVLFWKVVVVYLVVSLFIVLGIVILHLFYSHRIAGPAYRLGLEATRIASGDLKGDIKLRKKDNLTDMADMLNDMAAQYRRRIKEIQNGLVLIEARSRSMPQLIRTDRDGDGLKEAAAEIRISVNDINIFLDEIRT